MNATPDEQLVMYKLTCMFSVHLFQPESYQTQEAHSLYMLANKWQI